MTYYTNSTSMIADLEAGNLDFVDQVPFNAVSSLKGDSRFTCKSVAGTEVTNISFNSNPQKPKNRELLDPKVKEALEYATDRQADHRGRLRRPRAAVGEPALGCSRRRSGSIPSIQPLRTTSARPTRSSTRSATRRAPDGIRDGAGDHRQVRPAGP